MNINKSKTIAWLILALVPVCGMAGFVSDRGSSGVNDNGTLMGSASIVSDARFGKGALHVPPGDDNYMAISLAGTDLDMFDAYTFMTWFKHIVPGEKGLIVLGNCCTTRNGYQMSTAMYFGIHYWGGSTPNHLNYNQFNGSPLDFADGEWHHATIRVQEQQVDMFIDGVQGSVGSNSNIPTEPSLAMENDVALHSPKIGGDGIGEGSEAETIIDEVRVYGRALSDSEIVDAMNNKGPDPDRLFYTFEKELPKSGICKDEIGKAFGLCVAYCEAMDCDSTEPGGSEKACATIAGDFAELTSRDLPCQVNLCPCAAEPEWDEFLQSESWNDCVLGSWGNVVDVVLLWPIYEPNVIFSGRSLDLDTLLCNVNSVNGVIQIRELTPEQNNYCQQDLLTAAEAAGVACRVMP